MFDHLKTRLRASTDPLATAARHAIEDLTDAPLDFTPDERKVELDEEIDAAPSNERLLRDLRDDIRAMERAIRTLNAGLKRAQEEVAAAKADAAKVLASGFSLIAIVEGVKGAIEHGTWRAENTGGRLKDTPEWVAFYVAHRARKEGKAND
ncbi:hypothetical protein C4N9_20710 [Pararhodobacter marinus]|uniref:Uncharacterized protein n=1 Tax=Pararhodobacter marinus TaxID=2184063 RepID=A0A2U2C473_9RHOB|nr:hypothetical protein [Pararhodobacter marinus]PWE26685.1 hypothetical protein C4N9_20710 [Pararhodobacter marinus]